VARNRHIEAIRAFNDQVTVPPSSFTNSLFYHYEKMSQWSVDEAELEAIEAPPEVKF
jgi:LemA protein